MECKGHTGVTPVDGDGARKSLGRETTLDTDIADPVALETLLLGLVEMVAYALRGEGLLGRTVTLKLKDAEFRLTTRQVTLERPTDLGAPIFAAAGLYLERVEYEARWNLPCQERPAQRIAVLP